MSAVMYVGVCIYVHKSYPWWKVRVASQLQLQLLSIKAAPPYNPVLQIPDAILHEMEENCWKLKWGWTFFFGRGCSFDYSSYCTLT